MWEIEQLIVICTTVVACVAAICFTLVMIFHAPKARSWARTFREGAGVRIAATLVIVLAGVFLSAGGLLTESFTALLSAIAGFTLGGALPAAAATKVERPARSPSEGRLNRRG